MARLHLIWTVLAGLLFNQAMAQAVDLGPPAYTLSVSPQPRKISVLGSVFIGISGCQVVTSPIGNPGAKTLTRMDKTFDQNCDVYYISEAVDLSHTYLAIDGKGVLSIFHFTSDLLSYSRTTFYQIPYTAYYYPRVYKMERIPNTNIFFVAALQTNIIFKVMVEPGGLAELTKYLTNERSQSYETMAATNNNRLVTMSASGQYMELWDTTTMSFITLLEFSPFVFGNIYRSVAYYPIVSQQDFIMAPKTGLVAHFIDLTNKLIVYEFAIKQENPEFCYHVPQTNYFAVMDPANIDFLNVLNPSQSKTFAVAIGQSMDTIGAHFFTRLGTGYLLLTFSPGGAAAGRVYDLGTNFCHVTCATCAASLDPSRCTSCQIGYNLTEGKCTPMHSSPFLYNNVTGQPVTSCPASTYRTAYNACVKCPSQCTSCRDVTGFCLSCDPLSRKVVDVEGKCAASCWPYYEFQKDNRCYPCHPTCYTCAGNFESACTSCRPGTKLESGKCVPTTPCQANLSFHWIKLACLPCNTTTEEGIPVSISEQTCTSCANQNLGYSCNQCTSPYVNDQGLCNTACQHSETNKVEAKCVICEQKPLHLENMYFAGRCLTKGYCPSNYNYSEANLTCVLSPTSSGGIAEDPPTVVPNSKSASSGTEILVIVVFIILFTVGFVILGRFCFKTAQHEVIATTSLFYESTRQIQYTEESPLNVSPEIDAELDLSIGFKQPQGSEVFPSNLVQNPVPEPVRVSVEQQHQLSRESRPSSVHKSTVHKQNLEGFGDEQNPLAHIRFEEISNRVGQVAEQNVDLAAEVPVNQPRGETPLPISNSGSRQNFGPSLQNNRLSIPRLASRNDHDSFEEMEEIPEEIHAD